MNTKLTPAARKWLVRAATESTVWPTFGPYKQLVTAGLMEGPQQEARITDAGRALVFLVMADA